MRLHHFIFYLYFLAVNLVTPVVAAQPPGDNTPPTPEVLSTTITPDWLAKQQPAIVKAQAALEKERQAWKAEEKNFPKKLEELNKSTQPITEETLKPAAEAKDAANSEVEKLLSERQLTQNHLDNLQKTLQKQQKQLEGLSKSPSPTKGQSTDSPTLAADSAAPSKVTLPAPDTANTSSDKPNVSPKKNETKPEKAIDTHTDQETPAKPTSPLTKISQVSLQPSTPAAPTAAELKSSLELLQKAIGLQTIYVSIFGERYQLASQHLKLAIQWYDQLRAKFVQRQLQEQQDTINVDFMTVGK